MKFFRLVLCVCLLFGLFCNIVFADTVTESAIQEPVTVYEDQADSRSVTVVVNSPDNSQLLQAISDISSSRSDQDSISDPSVAALQLRSVNVSNETISASDANGFKAVVLDLLGDYTTIITDYTYSNTQGYTQHSIDVTPDWSWIITAGIFTVVVYCAFRLIGGILCSR